MKSFDPEAAAQGKPLIDPTKRSTQTNIVMVLALTGFIALAMWLLLSTREAAQSGELDSAHHPFAQVT